MRGREAEGGYRTKNKNPTRQCGEIAIFNSYVKLPEGRCQGINLASAESNVLEGAASTRSVTYICSIPWGQI